MKGFREKPKKDRLEELEKMVSNMQMAMGILQQIAKKLLGEMELRRNDVQNAINLANDLQYRTLAILELGAFDKVKLEQLVEMYKLKDYNDASDKEDAEKNLVPADVLDDNSTVILTSTTNSDKDAGIFRSKFAVAQCPYEQLKKDLVGKKVGDKLDADLSGIIHHIEIIGIRQQKQEVKA